ncbi:polysaccharide deacetylase family sporulation protein PdaB [Bacillus fonticola]|uniref:polysaccharide deacetylase family sporulation protein PdaB n=1 Tax=Bacillus fonticola TaxID=2728853 RepID=UPI0014737FE6|nr:polysaccharide deacetylase family sporulation protein PdaB [Bacillus fonticola]
MKGFYVVHAKNVRTTVLIVTLALFTAGLVYMQSFSIFPAFSTDQGPKAFYRGDKGIVLSFNIGWGDEKAEPIVDYLEENKVKPVTFFLSGAWAERHPDLVRKIEKAGHEIGLLGYNYEDYTELSDKEIIQDIQRAQSVFEKLKVETEPFLRAPTGQFDERLIRIAEKMGLSVIHWSVDSKDWTNPGTEEIIDRVKKAENGDIVLLHASDSAKQTEAALPQILEYIQTQDFELTTVSELISGGTSSTEDIQ